MPFVSHKIEGQLPRGIRLDRYVSEVMRLLPRSQIKAKKLKAKINGKEIKFSRPVKSGDIIELSWEEMECENIVPQDIPLDIIYEDERCVVINKQQGFVVHPGAGNRQGTLVNALCFRRQDKKGVDFSAGARSGIVHRLDKDTSGVIIAAYDDETCAFLSRQFKERKTRKNYIAIVHGRPKEEKGRIETFIARDPRNRKCFAVCPRGRLAVTFYKVIKSWQSYSLVLLRPKTGRTHQLRTHLKYLGCPILGDPLYGINSRHFPGISLMLHSKSLAVILPGETEERIFSSPVPERFRAVIDKLNKDAFNAK